MSYDLTSKPNVDINQVFPKIEELNPKSTELANGDSVLVVSEDHTCFTFGTFEKGGDDKFPLSKYLEIRLLDDATNCVLEGSEFEYVYWNEDHVLPLSVDNSSFDFLTILLVWVITNCEKEPKEILIMLDKAKYASHFKKNVEIVERLKSVIKSVFGLDQKG